MFHDSVLNIGKFAVISFMMAIFTFESRGSQLTVNVGGGLTTQYDRNFSLNSSDKRRVGSNSQSLSLELTRAQETGSLTAAGELRFRSFFVEDEDLPDRLSHSLTVSANEATERFSISTILSSETGAEESDEYLTSSGFVTIIEDQQKDRIVNSALVRSGYFVTEREQVNLGLGFSQLDYDDAENTSLTDYDASSISLGYLYQVTENWRAGFTISHERFDLSPSDAQLSLFNPSDSRSNTLFANVNYSGFENFQFELNTGFRRTDVTQLSNNLKFDESGNSLDLSGQYFTERSDYTITGSRALTPTTTGVLVERDSFTFRHEYKVSNRFSLNTVANASSEKEIRGEPEKERARNYSISPVYRTSELGIFSMLFTHKKQLRSSRVSSNSFRISWNINSKPFGIFD